MIDQRRCLSKEDEMKLIVEYDRYTWFFTCFLASISNDSFINPPPDRMFVSSVDFSIIDAFVNIWMFSSHSTNSHVLLRFERSRFIFNSFNRSYKKESDSLHQISIQYLKSLVTKKIYSVEYKSWVGQSASSTTSDCQASVELPLGQSNYITYVVHRQFEPY